MNHHPNKALEPGRRFVVSLRPTGLGDRLICLAAAWKYARDTGRVLIADWRHSIYNRSPENLFASCFEEQDDIGGVPFVGSSSIDTASLPRPVFPKIWEFGPLLSCPWVLPTDRLAGEPERSVAIIRKGVDLPEPTVVFNACVNDGLVSCRDAHEFLSALKPVNRVESEAREFLSRITGLDRLIGLHVRHGNGGNIMGHASSWTSFDLAIRRVEMALQATRQKLGPDAPVLLCTDSPEVVELIKARVPNVVCRTKEMRAKGSGELHHSVGNREGHLDALVEMVLLSKCRSLIRYPAASFFSFYPAVMKQGPHSRFSTISELQEPWNREDDLSPAIV